MMVSCLRELTFQCTYILPLPPFWCFGSRFFPFGLPTHEFCSVYLAHSILPFKVFDFSFFLEGLLIFQSQDIVRNFQSQRSFDNGPWRCIDLSSCLATLWQLKSSADSWFIFFFVCFSLRCVPDFLSHVYPDAEFLYPTNIYGFQLHARLCFADTEETKTLQRRLLSSFFAYSSYFILNFFIFHQDLLVPYTALSNFSFLFAIFKLFYLYSYLHIIMPSVDSLLFQI